MKHFNLERTARVLHVQIATTERQKQDAFDIRQQVFVIEQQVSPEEEYDEYDHAAMHVVLYDNGVPVAAGRTRTVDKETGKIERICVLASHRQKGAGRLIVEALEQAAIQRGLHKAKLHAQTQAEGFYQKLGYHTISDVFMEADIPHVVMVKEL
jgi:hypothetical protein